VYFLVTVIFALILALSRKIIESVERTRRGDFSLEGLRGFDLKGKTIGVIGTGRIGKHVIRMAKGFEMNIIAYDAYPDQKFAGEMGYKYVPLDELLSNSDVITLHAPLTDQTHHMINCENIKKVNLFLGSEKSGILDYHNSPICHNRICVSYRQDLIHRDVRIRGDRPFGFQALC
jgi:D-lactate dehydrogenase